ncbi:enoyl-CoA hydratase/isomerase family protein [Halioglobus pacificus]|uniref:3-hydroxybutyryl-CoA dehydratase n=1 Tax=Parahalioglobus pacificus TaxID=930806 RepID=A0A918XLP0_9GAMM|nr:enoyl-CoA hydratase-related protein [Halioglobus pacificus]GHD38060.1 3-hydroxybutyryl-CoA dehydratase [Halioglobus pacificus]
MADTISFEQQGAIGILTLNNPDKHNSLGKQELDGIQAVLRSVQSDNAVRALIVTGTGDKTFCAGASLAELNAGDISGDDFQATTDMLAALPIPTVCAFNGNVYGGGSELSLSCDFRIGFDGMKLRVPAATIGLCYPISGIQRFVERLGVGPAKRLLLAAEFVDSRQLYEMGFLDQLVNREAIGQASMDYAATLAERAPMAVAAMKKIINHVAAGTLDMDDAQALAKECSDSKDLQEGFVAQREKRAPVFKGL